LDKIIKPGSDTFGSHPRSHNFLPIDETISRSEDTLADTSRVGFKRGLLRKENRCPTLSGMDAMLSNRPSTDEQDTDILEEPPAVACILERFSEAIKHLEEERDAIYEHAAEETVKLALAISEKIIHHELRVNPDMILNIVRKAMQKIKDSQPICIRINPHDLEALKLADPDMSYLDTSAEGFAFQPDATMARGDCLVETRQGDIDAGIHSQLALIKEAFASLRGGDI